MAKPDKKWLQQKISIEAIVNTYPDMALGIGVFHSMVDSRSSLNELQLHCESFRRTVAV